MELENGEIIGTVHDALNRAVTQTKPENAVAISARVSKELRDEASIICKAHGTTMSAFVRQCIEVLVADYGGDHGGPQSQTS